MAKESHKGENISSLNDLSEVNNYRGKRFGKSNLNRRVIRQSGYGNRSLACTILTSEQN